jgi:glutamate 5-kinase
MRRAPSKSRIIVKVGTSCLVDNGGLDQARLDGLCDSAADLMAGGDMPVLVASGAIALGRNHLRELIGEEPTCAQVAAAVGQSQLFEAFREGLDQRGMPAGQFLLTPPDLVEQEHRAGVRRAFDQALEWGIVPVVNENDAIAVRNNDILAALLSAVIGARLLVIITDVAGLYEADPRCSPAARPIRELRLPSPKVERFATASVQGVGTGGMTAKLCASWIATSTGVTTVIASSAEPDVLVRAAHGEEIGTIVHPRRYDGVEELGRLWRAFRSLPEGFLVCDDRTEDLIAAHAPIPSSRVIKASGGFLAGNTVEVVGPGAQQLARGRARLDMQSLAMGAPPEGRPDGQAIILDSDDYVSLLEVEACP